MQCSSMAYYAKSKYQIQLQIPLPIWLTSIAMLQFWPKISAMSVGLCLFALALSCCSDEDSSSSIGSNNNKPQSQLGRPTDSTRVDSTWLNRNGCFFSCCGLRVTAARFRLSPDTHIEATHTHTGYTHTGNTHSHSLSGQACYNKFSLL